MPGLGLAVFVFIIIFCFKYNKKIKSNKAFFIEFGITEQKHSGLVFSNWLYLFPLAVMIIPHKLALMLISPFPIILLAFFPGIILGWSISKKLDTCGIDRGVYAGRDASNSMWLGIGAFILVFLSWLF